MSDFDIIVDNFFKNYKDRGMKKWQGFYLSDQTSKVEKMWRDEAKVEVHRPEQSIEEIGELLMIAYSTRIPVNVQLKLMDHNGNYYQSLNGFVSGYEDDEAFVDNNPIELDSISSVEFIS